MSDTPAGSWREAARRLQLDPERLVRSIEYVVRQLQDPDTSEALDHFEVYGGSEEYQVQMGDASLPFCDCGDAAWRGEEVTLKDGTKRDPVLCAHFLATMIFLGDERTVYLLGRAVRKFTLERRIALVLTKKGGLRRVAQARAERAERFPNGLPDPSL
jgi:hypothetical protein